MEGKRQNDTETQRNTYIQKEGETRRTRKTEGDKDLSQLNDKSQMKSHINIINMESGRSILIQHFIHPITCSKVIFIKPFSRPHRRALPSG